MGRLRAYNGNQKDKPKPRKEDQTHETNGFRGSGPAACPVCRSLFRRGACQLPAIFFQRQPADDTFLPVELSYHIFRPFRRKGYALEACRAVLSYCQEQISPDIFARIRPDNIPSRNLVQKLIVQ